MPRASRNVRKLRRIKRERTLALQMAEFAIKQRDEARAIANVFGAKLKELSPVEQAKKNDLVITRVEETDEVVQLPNHDLTPKAESDASSD